MALIASLGSGFSLKRGVLLFFLSNTVKYLKKSKIFFVTYCVVFTLCDSFVSNVIALWY